MLNCKPCRTPVDTDSKLSADGAPISDSTLYRSLAGALQYLTFTRPDISYAVQQVCLFMHDPREPHLSALKEDLTMRIGRVVPLLVDQPLVIVFFPGNISLRASKRQFTLLLDLVLRLRIGFANAGCRKLAVTLSNYIDIHFVRDLVATGAIRVLHVPSRYQYADIFPKVYLLVIFDDFIPVWKRPCPPAPTAVECSQCNL
ncbi:ribonuclease H-like domain-containing protein [Tanacetum coccineum]|uniref:Ribonuclease H-like domain-containing protein n=1 Tax=Tanacetum coccineum TaxID=301880 RepID=A0ABQ5C3K9_9ASTR